MAATLKKEFGLDAEIVRKSGGIFDVSVDNEKIYSKYDTGTFPSEKEIVDKLRAMAGAAAQQT